MIVLTMCCVIGEGGEGGEMYYSYRSGGAHQKVHTTQGGIFDLNMYVTFDCAGIAAF